jgi:enamine deaminase RidA (YjgF/YER057c/UK114 family)
MGEKKVTNKEIVTLQGRNEAAGFGLKVRKVREWLFIAGTVPRDTNNVVMGKKDIQKQMTRVFENIRDILSEGGFTLNDLIQLNVYLTDGSHRQAYLEFAEKLFMNNPVAQSVLVVKGLNDPDVLIEIDGIACIA